MFFDRINRILRIIRPAGSYQLLVIKLLENSAKPESTAQAGGAALEW
jgi:hypothetical protein